MTATRHCRKCHQDKPAAAFNPKRRDAQCRKCLSEYMHAYWLRNNPGAKRRGQRNGNVALGAEPGPRPARAPCQPEPPPKPAAPRARYTLNFTRDDTQHELALIAHGAQIVHDCFRPWFALQIITDLWAARRMEPR